MKRKGKEFIVAFILSASTPHALSCHSYSACRRSHFVRSSRVSLITCLFLLAVNCLFTFLATRMFAMCLSLLLATAVGLCSSFSIIDHHSSIEAVLFPHTNVATEPPD